MLRRGGGGSSVFGWIGFLFYVTIDFIFCFHQLYSLCNENVLNSCQGKTTISYFSD